MNDVARKRYVRGCILALILVIAAIILLRSCDPTKSGDGDGDSGGSGEGRSGDPSSSFTIKGNASEVISPGVTVSLDLEITNPHNFPLAVTGLDVTLSDIDAPRAGGARPCTVGDFQLTQASDVAITIAARSTSTFSSLDLDRKTWPQVGMLNRPVNQDGCKGASLKLGYTASGTRGDR
ncbi:MAG: hypothetical protein M3Q98_01805 [Actinomycetota bacterium]|nr:hypothetical protein [Actinomycetota bacterium]